MARPWTQEDTTRLTELHAAGKSLHAIAADMGRSKSTISEYAQKAGLVWDRAKTAAAAEAVSVDNKARRVRIVARLYTQVETELDGLEEASDETPWRTILKGEYGTEHQADLPFVPPRDRRDVSDIISRHMITATKLEAVDTGERDTSAVASWLSSMLSRR